MLETENGYAQVDAQRFGVRVRNTVWCWTPYKDTDDNSGAIITPDINPNSGNQNDLFADREPLKQTITVGNSYNHFPKRF